MTKEGNSFHVMSFHHLPSLHSEDIGRPRSASLPQLAALPHTLDFTSELFLKLSDFPSRSVLLQHGILSLKIALHPLGL